MVHFYNTTNSINPAKLIHRKKNNEVCKVEAIECIITSNATNYRIVIRPQQKRVVKLDISIQTRKHVLWQLQK